MLEPSGLTNRAAKETVECASIYSQHQPLGLCLCSFEFASGVSGQSGRTDFISTLGKV